MFCQEFPQTIAFSGGGASSTTVSAALKGPRASRPWPYPHGQALGAPYGDGRSPHGFATANRACGGQDARTTENAIALGIPTFFGDVFADMV